MSDNWSDVVPAMSGVGLTWNPPQYGSSIDFEGVKTSFAVQYVVAYQAGDNFLLNVEASLDGANWTSYAATPYVAGFGLPAAAGAAGTATAILYVTDYPFRFLRVVGDNRNTGGAPSASAFVAVS